MISFKEMGLHPIMLKTVEDIGFEMPTLIQEKTIPVLLNESGDILALAQTGTGKTAAFGLPIVQMTDAGSSATQCLILCPTRELCLQIKKDLTSFARFKTGINIVAVYGGASINDQISKLDKGAGIVVATPGRAVDLAGRGSSSLTRSDGWFLMKLMKCYRWVSRKIWIPFFPLLRPIGELCFFRRPCQRKWRLSLPDI